MHEATIACAILDYAIRRLEQLGEPGVVSTVHLRIGQFRNVDPDSLKFAFDALKTAWQPLADCHLRMEMVPATALCHANNHEYHAVPERLYRCDQCDSGLGHLQAGEELDITGITICSQTPALMPGCIEECGGGGNPRRTDLKNLALKGEVSLEPNDTMEKNTYARSNYRAHSRAFA